MKHKLKIFFGIFLSLIVVNLGTPRVFLGSTPQINPFAADNLINGPRNFIANLGKSPTSNESGVVDSAPSEVVFSSIAPGVEAAEDSNNTYLKVKEGTTINEETVASEDGKEIKRVTFSQ